MICSNLSVNSDGALVFAGADVRLLAAKYGTPLYLMDENRIRSNCRAYTEGVTSFPGGGIAAFAGKAASFKEMYRIIADEGMFADVVSPGEVNTAFAAGFPMDRLFFHSNNKSDADIAFGIDRGVGYFVVDGEDELFALDRIAKEKGIVQKILLRLTPGIDPHTFEAVATGKVDSKFGAAIETGQAKELFLKARGCKNVSLEGFHCHVGSQVFESGVFFDAARIMLGFVASLKNEFGFTTRLLDLGGGYGTRYVETDPFIDITDNVRQVAGTVKTLCASYGIDAPVIALEPGRSIVADAGLTLYTAGSVKRIPGYKNYVSVDGGMTDNPRFALYGSKYTVLPADRMNEERTFECSLVGRCCESGDIIQEHVFLPEGIKRGDLIAVCTTGAYNYSMSSNYNRVPRPPVVMLRDGADRVAVRRETVDDIIALDF
ncbi:MAG: diaminopimelate decarboxylase [Clostridia bacterium]|nr:diaminopimelate decarboxylase [Clostridia bacterium]